MPFYNNPGSAFGFGPGSDTPLAELLAQSGGQQYLSQGPAAAVPVTQSIDPSLLMIAGSQPWNEKFQQAMNIAMGIGPGVMMPKISGIGMPRITEPIPSRAASLPDKPYYVFDTRNPSGYEGFFPTEAEAMKFINSHPNAMHLDYGTPRTIEGLNPTAEESPGYTAQHIRDVLWRFIAANSPESIK